jgi:hypothetical protein
MPVDDTDRVEYYSSLFYDETSTLRHIDHRISVLLLLTATDIIAAHTHSSTYTVLHTYMPTHLYACILYVHFVRLTYNLV